MTRVNVVPVGELHRLHLVAEYREIPRVFTGAHQASRRGAFVQSVPLYCLGAGHVTFFYDKLGYISERHQALVQEMLRRGYKPTITMPHLPWLSKIPEELWGSYTPTPEAVALNRARIAERMPT